MLQQIEERRDAIYRPLSPITLIYYRHYSSMSETKSAESIQKHAYLILRCDKQGYAQVLGIYSERYPTVVNYDTWGRDITVACAKGKDFAEAKSKLIQELTSKLSHGDIDLKPTPSSAFL